MKKLLNKNEIILFLGETIFMSLELVASRILSSYFGNTNIIWTSIIGIILFSSSLGNYLGGIIADKKENEKSMKLIFTLTSCFIFLIPIVQYNILNYLSNEIDNIKIGAILSTLILFFAPSLLLGLINPIVLKNRLNELDNAGKISGKLYAISTLGGIFGTFLCGFFLLPNLGNMEILFSLSIICLILSLLFKSKHSIINILIVITFITFQIILLISYHNNNLKNIQKVLNGKENVTATLNTSYDTLYVFNDQNKTRHLKINNGYESATYIDEERKNELVYEYTKYYDLMLNSNIDINNVLMIGGGGYSYPKYFINKYAKNIDVVEIDEGITKTAKNFFFLEDSNKLKIFSEDGRTYLNKNQKKYDAILNDAFKGLVPPPSLTTIEAIKNIKNSLNENGVYLTNIISSLDGENSKFLKSEIKTINTIFKHVYVTPCKNKLPLYTQNIMVIATDDTINIENTYKIKITDDNIILTDNFSPIEKLIT